MVKKWIIYSTCLLSIGILTACSPKSENVDVSEELNSLRKEVTTTVITNTTTADSSTTSDAPVNPTTSVPTTSSVFPEELIGNWRGNDANDVMVTMEFFADGHISTQVGTNPSFYTTNINSIEEVGPSTYRYHFAAGEKPYAVVPTFQLGGAGVKYDYGFRLEGGTLTLLVWNVPTTEDFDYSQPIRTQLNLYKE